MAPKKMHGVRKVKRPRVSEPAARVSPEASPVERRTKARNDPLQPPTASSPPPPHGPKGTISTRQVATGRNIDFDFLSQEGFTIGNKIREMGWEYFCSLNLPTYPDLVKEFYKNFSFGVGSVESTVKGTWIVLDIEKLGRILKMPTEDSSPSSPSDFSDERTADLRLILGRESVTSIENVSANSLTVEMRLLHHIISRIFFPKIGRFDFVTARDIKLMGHILRGSPVCLPRLIFQQMKDATSKTTTILPYGMVLSVIFDHFGISVEGENQIKLRHFCTYNLSSLRRMQFEKVDEVWVRKSEPLVQPEAEPDTSVGIGHDDQEAAPEAPVAPPSPAPAAEPSAAPTPPTFAPSSLDDNLIDKIACRVMEKLQDNFDGLHGRIDVLSSRVTALERRLPSEDKDDIRQLYCEAAKLKMNLESTAKNFEERHNHSDEAMKVGFNGLMSKLKDIETWIAFSTLAAPSVPPASRPSSSAHPPPPPSDVKPSFF